MSDGQGDARGYSWPPFEPGHTASLLHGARSERTIAPLAEQIAAELLAAESTPAHLLRREFAAAVQAWARAEAVVALLWRWLDEQDIGEALTEVTSAEETETHGKRKTTRRSVSRRVASVLGELHRAETRAASMRRALGLDPLSAGRLAKDLSASRWYQGATPLDRKLDQIEAERQAAAIEAAEDA
jgi:hypothetical protein